jgi:hypothetical protein
MVWRKAHLKELIERIECYCVGHQTLADEVADLMLDADPALARSRLFQSFLKHLKEQRGKEGRFVRVFFKAGFRKWVNLVPPGSLAAGLQLMQDARNQDDPWRLVSPELRKTWEDFQAGRRQRTGRKQTAG